MEARDLLIITHLIGFAMLFTAGVSGWILNRQYGSAPDLGTKGTILRAMRPIGLLSPVAILIMIITGIGKMHLLGLGIFSESWLALKLLFFLIAATVGIVFGARARVRARILGSLAGGEPTTGASEGLAKLDRQFKLFYLFQLTLLLLILLLSVIKPGRYGL